MTAKRFKTFGRQLARFSGTGAICFYKSSACSNPARHSPRVPVNTCTTPSFNSCTAFHHHPMKTLTENRFDQHHVGDDRRWLEFAAACVDLETSCRSKRRCLHEAV